MPGVSSRAKISENLAKQDAGVKGYFGLLEELLDKISSPEPALAYCFQRIEAAQRIALYALLMREYRTNSELTWGAVDREDITRTTFPQYYQEISGKKLPANVRDLIKSAEQVRDDITHGRSKSPAEINRAILKCLEYAEALNNAFFQQVGFRPIGPLRGVTGRRGRPQLDKKISRIVLKGLGFAT